MDRYFDLDDRLGICLPALEKNWEEYTIDEQSLILSIWEQIRAGIPDRIRHFEHQFMDTFDALNEAIDGDELGRLSTEMAEISSVINELNVWYREEPNVSHHH